MSRKQCRNASRTEQGQALLAAQIKTPTPEITVVVVGDIHAGSKNALCVPEMEFVDGQGSIRHSAAQRALYDCWQTLVKDWHAPDILICNGDAIEGQARKESGVGTWSVDLWDQVKCAQLLIQEFQAKKHYIVDGTGYHVDAAGKSLEFYLGEKLGAEKIGAGGAQSADELFLRVANTTIHASHHIQVGTGWYRTTPLARELIFALLTETSKHRVDLVLRAHCHYFCGIEFCRQQGFINACWQMQTRYMRKKSSLGMVPDIGALRFRITPTEIKLDKRFFKPVECKPKLFVFEPSETPSIQSP